MLLARQSRSLRRGHTAIPTFSVFAQIGGITALKSTNLAFQMFFTRVSSHVVC